MFRFAIRKTARNVTKVAVPKRNMGGHAKGPPPEGFEGTIRKYFPEDHHVALVIIGGYFSLYLFSKLIFGGKKKAAPAAVTANASSSSADGEVPSVDSAAFGDWLAKDGNIEKYMSK